MKRIYIAGPVSNGNTLDHHTRGLNVRRAVLAGEELRRVGLLPYVPHLLEQWVILCSLTYDQVMALCLEEVRRSDAVLRLPGASRGADMETARAGELGLPVFGAVEHVVRWARGG